MRTTPEQEVLLLCGRVRLENGPAHRLRKLLQRGDLDWKAVLDLGERHATTPLLHHHLSTQGARWVPAPVLGELRKRYLAIAARSLALGRELVEILEVLEDAGCPGVAWKGPVLAARFYPGPDLRSFNDLDLIVRRRDVEGALDVLKARGYVSVPGRDLPEEERVRSPEQDLTMEHPETGILLDLHWGRVQRYHSVAMDCDVLWEESERVVLHGREIRALAADTLLIALVLHGAKHGPFPWPSLKWVTDMEALVRARPEGWWPGVFVRARSVGCFRRLLLGLLLARELLETPLPEAVETALREEPGLADLVPGIRQRLLATGPVEFTLGDRLAFDLAVRERRRDRMRYRARRLLLPGRRDARRLPVPLRFLQPPLRLIRLARGYALRPSRLRRLLGGGET